MQQFVQLICQKIQAFTESEILSLIPPETLATIKAKDPHPFFQAYSICHEGVSMPTILGEQAKPIHWIKKAVQSIKTALLKGVKFFKGHNEDNSTTGRRELGEVVHSFEKEIDGVLHHVVISYHSPDVREEVKQYDICSQEAEWDFFEVAGNLVADTVEKITGIALGSSETEEPAFSGARRMGLVQAFGVEDPNKNKGEPKQMTFQELKDEVKKLNVWPSQLYTLDELKQDRVFSPIFTENENLKGQVSTKDNEIKQLKEKELQLNKQTQTSTAKTRWTNLLNSGDVKLTDEQKEYANLKFKEDRLTDLTDDGLKKFRDSLLTDFQENAAFWNKGKQTETHNNQGGGSGTTDKNDLTKASNNELLMEDVSLE